MAALRTCWSSLKGSAVGRDLSWFFQTIAVLLGTGILGLPIKLVHCGYWPFVFILTVTAFMQISIVYLQADTLQYAAKLLPAIDLHTMGKHLLGGTGSRIFDFFVLLNFVSIMISYTLAAATGIASVLGASDSAVISPFIAVCGLCIIFIPRLVQVGVSIFTSIKVAVLIVVIGLVGIVAGSVGINPHDNWTALMQPFLVGTVAIGGICQMMPVMFPSHDVSRSTMLHFRWSIVLGIITCYVLNLTWARFVLGVVPQTREDAIQDGIAVSLEQAGADGDIATIPVTSVIMDNFPQFNWIRWSLSVFIITSILVSFNAIGLGLRHVLEGIATTLNSRPGLRWAAVALSCPPACARCPLRPTDRYRWLFDTGSLTAMHLVMYTAGFVLIWAVAFSDPDGFILVLETFTSLAINYSCGILSVQLNAEMRSAAAALQSALPVEEKHDRPAGVEEIQPLLLVSPTLPSTPGMAHAASPVALHLSASGALLLGVFAQLAFAVAIVYDAYNSLALVVTTSQATFVALVAILLLLKLNIAPSLLALALNLRDEKHGSFWRRMEGGIQLIRETRAMPFWKAVWHPTAFEHFGVFCVLAGIAACSAEVGPVTLGCLAFLLCLKSIGAMFPWPGFNELKRIGGFYCGLVCLTAFGAAIAAFVASEVGAGVTALLLLAFEVISVLRRRHFSKMHDSLSSQGPTSIATS